VAINARKLNGRIAKVRRVFAHNRRLPKAGVRWLTRIKLRAQKSSNRFWSLATPPYCWTLTWQRAFAHLRAAANANEQLMKQLQKLEERVLLLIAALDPKALSAVA